LSNPSITEIPLCDIYNSSNDVNVDRPVPMEVIRLLYKRWTKYCGIHENDIGYRVERGFRKTCINISHRHQQTMRSYACTRHSSETINYEMAYIPVNSASSISPMSPDPKQPISQCMSHHTCSQIHTYRLLTINLTWWHGIAY
jgi:hypothetical protein